MACSRQTKLAVADRTKITTTEDETRVIQPATLQAAIDALVTSVPNVSTTAAGLKRPGLPQATHRLFTAHVTFFLYVALLRQVCRAALTFA